MTAKEQERHILLIDEGDEQRSIMLDAATYSIGRDRKNAIVLPIKAISREHALLLRVPIPQSSSYRYRIVDGNAQGRLSANGIQVNGQRCRVHDLEKGDVILFAGLVKAAYLVVHMDPETLKEFFGADTAGFQSIKQATTNPSATLVDMDFDPSAHGIPVATPTSQSTNAVLASPPIQSTSQPRTRRQSVGGAQYHLRASAEDIDSAELPTTILNQQHSNATTPKVPPSKEL